MSRTGELERGGVMPLVPGDPERVGRWLLRARLGTGGMGTVYLGCDEGGHWAAVKVIHPYLLDDHTFAERFRREVSLATQVGNRFTARVIAADFEASPPFVATEYVSGPDLDHYVRRHGPLPAAFLIAFAGGLASALAEIHRTGIVHRDLTPRNVLLADDGPRVVDFGIARARGHAALTATGLVMGTPGWVAPEVLRGEESTFAGDVFAWGLLVAFAASGSNPFGDGPTDAILYSLAHGEPTIPELPGGLGAVVARALDKQPDARPTPRRILESLGGSTGADEDPAAALVDGSTWRPAGATEPIDLGGLLEERVTETIRSAPAQAPPRRRRRWALLGVAGLLLGTLLGSLAIPGLLETVRPVSQAETRTASTADAAEDPTPREPTSDAEGAETDQAPVEDAQPAPPDPEPVDERVTSDTPLTVAGLGPFSAGEVVTEAARRADVAMLPYDSPDGFWSEYGCSEVHPLDGPWAPDPQGYYWPVTVMVWDEDGPRIARVSVSDPRLRTPSGLGVGSTREEIIEALGAERITVEPHEYRPDDPTAASLVFRPSDPSESHLGMLFLIEDGRVVTIHAGLIDAIYMPEGCL